MEKDILDASPNCRRRIIDKLSEFHGHVLVCSACRVAIVRGNPRGTCRMAGSYMADILMAYSAIVCLTSDGEESRQSKELVNRIRKYAGSRAATQIERKQWEQSRLF